MSTTAEEPTGQADRPKPARKVSKAAKVGWSIYQQIAAVMAAFGIAALLGHFWDIGWKGALSFVVGVWDETIRPAAEWVFHVVVTVPFGWLGIHVEVPLWLRDYLSVGLVFGLAYVRVSRLVPGIEILERALAPKGISRSRLSLMPYVIAVWPVAIGVAGVSLYGGLVHSRDALRRGIEEISQMQLRAGRVWRDDDEEFDDAFSVIFQDLPRVSEENKGHFEETTRVQQAILALLLLVSPLLYLAFLLAVNFWVMPYI